jgi:TonB-linked SusC/RagA family outer membrane protein
MKKKRFAAAIYYVMRLTAIQLMLAAAFSLSLYANKVNSQSVLEKPISLSAEQMSVRKLLNQIRVQTGVSFTYSSDMVDVNQKISCQLEARQLKEFFNDVLKPMGIDFKVIDNQQILLYQAPADQSRKDIVITGRVLAENGDPVPGATVRIKGSSVGTTTGVDGRFTMSVPDKQAVLVISFIGYQQQEVSVGDQVNISIKLAAENSRLNEVVVVGYGTQRKKDITGAVAVVRSDAFENRPIVSAAAGLQGQAAGVVVTAPSGKPGAAMSVSIRGNTSLNASNDPLYVVDGVIVQNIDFLNPADIESYSVLKDASSAAIYGASGANGVVLITTKKGTNQSKVFVNAYTGMSDFAKKINVLNVDQYKDLMKEMGFTADGTANTDWQKETFKTGREQNIQVGVSGGTDKGHYYVSGGYQKQKGVVAPADYDRYSVRANIDNRVKDWLTLASNLSFNRSVYVDVPDNNGVAKGGTILAALTSPPTIGIYNPDGSYTANPNQRSWQNPIAYAFAPKQKAINNRFLGNVSADFTIIPELHFRSNLGVESEGYRYDYFLDPFSTDFGRNEKKGYGKSQSVERFVWLWENTLNYTKLFGKHNLNAMIGHTMQESNYNLTDDAAKGYSSDKIPTLGGSTIRETQSTTKSQWAKRSYLGRVNYGYDDRYLLTATLRYDGSSRFTPEGRYGWFPSVAGAWRISNEHFFNKGFVSDLKLRAGWGKTGNDAIGDYDWRLLFAPTTTGGLTQSNLPKDGLTWEKTAQSNVGIDASMLNNRLTVNLDAYIKKTTDLLVFVQTPPSSGYGSQRYNVGSIENKGVELSIGALAIDKAVRWNINGNISFNRNKVLSLGSTTPSLSYGGVYERGNAIRVEPGHPLGAFYGYIAEGVDPATGDMKYKDLDGSKSISDGDRTWIGNAQPDFVYALTNTVSYKNFELNVFFQGVHGNDIFNASRIELEGLYDSKNQSTAVLRRWKQAGDITDIPRAQKDNTNNSLVSSRFVENGAYLRLKSATLSYKFANGLLKHAGIGRLNVYVTAQNLFTITKYKGIDPEVSRDASNGPSMGVDYGTYPQARAFIFGLNAEF